MTANILTKIILPTLLIILSASIATAAYASELEIDQSNTLTNVRMVLSPYIDRSQTITAGTDGFLEKIELSSFFLNTSSDPEFCKDKISLRILNVVNGTPIDEQFAEAVNTQDLPYGSNGPVTFDYTEDSIELYEGQQFAISLQVLSPDCDFRWGSYSGANTGIDAYEGGESFAGIITSQGYVFVKEDYRDMTFRTFMNPSLTAQEQLEKLKADVNNLETPNSVIMRLLGMLKATEKTITNKNSENNIAPVTTLDTFIANTHLLAEQGRISQEEANSLQSLSTQLQDTIEENEF